MVEAWYPLAERNLAPKSLWGSYRDDDGMWKFVLHMTQSKTFTPRPSNYYGHTNYPHATIGDKIWQHIPINYAARALWNEPGGVETNADLAVQVEIVWMSEEAAQLPDAIIGRVRDFGLWVAAQTGMPWRCDVPFVGATSYPARVDAPQRMKPAVWDNYAGICGHQHVPENTHWDPGAFSITKLLNQEDDVPLDANDKQFITSEIQRIVSDNISWLVGMGDVWAGQGANLDQRITDIKAKLDASGGGGGGSGAISDTDVKRIADAVVAEIAS